jgi:hypothetical protein
MPIRSLCVLAFTIESAVAAPITLHHQSRLLDAAGAPIAGPHEVTLTLWDDATSTASGDRLWTAQYPATPFQDGYASFDLVLSTTGGAIDSAWFAAPVWLEVSVGGAPLGPRLRVRDVPGASGTGTVPNVLEARNTGGTRVTSAMEGTPVVVVGHAFGSSPQVLFDESPLTLSSASDTSVQFTAPALSATSDLVVVNTTAGTRSNPLPFRFQRAGLVGDGSDGAATLTSTVGFSRTTLTTSAVAGSTTLPASPTALGASVGTLLLVINLQGASAGAYEFVTVAGTSGGQIQTTTPLVRGYPVTEKVIVQRVPEYTNVTISGTVTTDAFNGTGGGVFAIAASGTLTIPTGSSINVDGLGYRGNGWDSGESWNGAGCREGSMNNGGCVGAAPAGCRLRNQGGGGGIWDTPACPEPGSGGGGYGTPGGNGVMSSNNACYGQGGGTYGVADLSYIFHGSAGGRNNNSTDTYASGAVGGSGGGIVIVLANQVQLDGTITSRGTNGGYAHHQGAGGGSGGSILVRTRSGTPTVDVGKLIVTGGLGATDPTSCANPAFGGNGGAGRAYVQVY